MFVKKALVCGMDSPIGIGWTSPLFSFVSNYRTPLSIKLYSDKSDTPEQVISIQPEDFSGFRFPAALRPETKYRWEIHDKDLLESFWFETAADLDAPFLTPSSEDVEHPIFSKEFEVPLNISSARLTITGLGLYKVFCNGKPVGNRYLTPGLNDYDNCIRYQTYDLQEYLLSGQKNRLQVVIGNGWYSGRYGIDKPISGGNHVWGEHPLLCAKITLIDQNQNRLIIDTETPGWQVQKSFVISDSIYDGEVHDYLHFEPDALDKFSCKPLKIDCRKVPDDTLPLVSHETFSPIMLTSPKGEKILDFGQNFAGFVRIHKKLKKGVQIRLQHGEILQDGCFYRDNLRTAKAEAIYISDGTERTYEPFFSYFGFRYVLVECEEHVEAKDFLGVAIYQDITPVGSCITSHEGLNKLMKNTLWGQKSNFVEIPTDCPQRDERLGWTADALVFAPTACYRANCLSFYQKYLNDLRYEQVKYYSGDLPMYAPSLKGEAGHGGAIWSDVATFLPMTLWDFYGSKELLSDSYPMMRDYAFFLIQMLKESPLGLIFGKFTFGDWLAGDGMTENALKGGTDDDFLTNAYAFQSIRLTARAAKILGREDEQKQFSSISEQLKKAILKEYFSENGRLTVNTQTAYFVSLAFGLSENTAALTQGLSKRLRSDFYRLKTGFAGTPLALPTLFRFGFSEHAYRILFRREYPSWLYEVEMGATTIWERWNSVLPNGKISGTGMNSLNHYSYGSVCEAIYAWIVGLRPQSPGWRSVIFQPHPGWQLKKISFSFDSPVGTYSAIWELSPAGKFLAELEVPEGASACVLLPDGSKSKTLSAGRHSLSCNTQNNLLHPYNENSLLLDILANDEATAILQKYLPIVYERATGESPEFQVEPLNFFQRLPMFGVSTKDLQTCLKNLKMIRV